MKDKGIGKMYAQFIIFIIRCIPVILCAICFGAAGWIYIDTGEIELLRHWMVVGLILGAISFAFAACGVLVSDPQPLTKDEDEC